MQTDQGVPRCIQQDDNYPPEGRDQEQNHTSPKIYRWKKTQKTRTMKTSLVLLVFREKV